MSTKTFPLIDYKQHLNVHTDSRPAVIVFLDVLSESHKDALYIESDMSARDLCFRQLNSLVQRGCFLSGTLDKIVNLDRIHAEVHFVEVRDLLPSTEDFLIRKRKPTLQ